jgi:hypothetical protein
MSDQEFEQMKKDFINARTDNPTCYDAGEIPYLREEFFKNHVAKLMAEFELARAVAVQFLQK